MLVSPQTVRRYHLQRRYIQNGVNAEARNRAQEVKDVAILGGGITGLVSAFYLSKQRPDIRITIFEGSSRLGGWLHSKQVDVGNGNVVFEQGPRTLRPNFPNGLITLKLVKDLGIDDQLIYTSKNSVAAQNRYVYYPDHLVRMPGPGMTFLNNLSNIWNEPVFNGLFESITGDLTTERRSHDRADESIGSFFARRCSSKIVDNLISAVLHGIYAGDVYNLSMRTLIPRFWDYESKYRSLIIGSLDSAGNTPISLSDWAMLQTVDRELDNETPASERLQAAGQSSVFTFQKGLGELVHQLEAHLKQNSMVDIQQETLVTDLRLHRNGPSQKIRVATKSSTENKNSDIHVEQFTHVISTLSGKTLSNIARSETGQQVLSSFQQTPSVTVMVVNLFFSDPNVLPVHGFGYLIPRSVPYAQNPERALGVVFDSDAAIGQDSTGGTKVTVMLGGHWWDQWDSYPDEDQGASMAKAILRRHLKISAEPDAIRVSLQRDCIPQYTVGHHERLVSGSHELEKNFDYRLRVAGNSYSGVGLNDCVRAAREVAQELTSGRQDVGLGWYLKDQAKYDLKTEDLREKPWRHSNPFET